jgi:hypothetical protein
LARIINNVRLTRAYRGKYGTLVHDRRHKHAPCSQIPDRLASQPVLSCVRNPYDRYVSEYEFNWWRKRRWLKYYRAVPEFEKRYAAFPDLTFEQWMTLQSEAFSETAKTRGPHAALGLQTEHFIKHHFKDALNVLPRVTEEYVASGRYRRDMYDVTFVRTDRLNDDLYRFLSGMNYDAEDLQFIRSHQRVIPGADRRLSKKWQQYYSPALKQEIRRKEWLLFTLFPEFDL